MNSSERIAVQRYAAAYDRLSQTTQEAVRRAADLSAAARALDPVRRLLTAPQISLAQKKAAVKSALSALPQVASFVSVLLEAKRYALLPQIVTQVEAFLDARQGIIRAHVFSAQPLSDKQRKHTQEVLSSRYGKTVKADFKVDKNLLGGLKIWCNGELLDGSVQTQLARLQEELTK